MTTHATEPQMLDRGDGRIAFDVIGDHGPLIVCVPGMGELRSSYRHNTRPLADAGYRVATMDLRGHGDSDATFSSYDDVAAATDLLALIDQLRGPALVVGNSMGAGAAVWAAAERPDLIAGIALLGPFVRQTPINPVLAWAFRIAMSGPWAPTVWHSYLPSLSPKHKPADFAQHRADIRASMRRPGHAKSFSATTRTSHAPAQARLSDVETPALVVMGTADPDFTDPAAEARWITEHLSDAQQLLIKDAGHYPQAEDPAIVNPALISFAGTVLPGVNPAARKSARLDNRAGPTLVAAPMRVTGRSPNPFGRTMAREHIRQTEAVECGPFRSLLLRVRPLDPEWLASQSRQG